MRKLVALRSLLPATFCLLIAGSLFAAQGCTAGEGTTPTCEYDLDENGNKNVDPEKACNGFAVCRANPLDPDSKVLPAAECCKDSDGNPFLGDALEACLAGYGEGEFPTQSTSASSTSSSSGGGGGGGGGGDSK